MQQEGKNMTHENGIDRLFRLWPQIVAIKYPDDPELIEANATPKAAKHFFAESEVGSFRIGYADNPDHVALAYIVEAARHLCGVDHPGALRLLRVAIEEIENKP